MTIQLNPEQEQLIGQAIQAGLIRDANEVVHVGVETIRQRLEARLSSKTPMNAEDWSREFHDWVQSHPTTTPLLSDEAISRDSIYGTRSAFRTREARISW
jgi:Arc/MetJ-type ribon-helix-helix transcriptional regulator